MKKLIARAQSIKEYIQKAKPNPKSIKGVAYLGIFYFIIYCGKIYRMPKYIFNTLFFPILKQRSEKKVQNIFQKIYYKNIWGEGFEKFYSGPGSHEEALYIPYIDYMLGYFKKHNCSTLRVVDLGCGDLNVSKHFIPHCGQYIGVDIVEELIQKHNNSHYPDNSIFQVSDIIQDELPDGNIAFLRQVLQHLSNEQIVRILGKLKKYETVFITEHYPKENLNTVPNRNIIPGANTRVILNSGVYLDRYPFNLSAILPELVLEIPIESGYGGYIRTYKCSF